MIAEEPEHGITKTKIHNDPAVAGRNVRAAVPVHPVRGVAERGMLDDAEQVDRHQPRRRRA